MEKVFKIFVDFDGTITREDTGDAIFSKFGHTETVQQVISDLLGDRISAKDCWLKLCESVGSINKNELDNFILGIEIDTTFHSFTEYCKKNNFDMFILSDGFDYYINIILQREKLGFIPVFSNKLEIDNKNKLTPSFPFYDSGCISSANCKRNHIINNSADDDFTVFIGDGNSDKYTVHFCDFVFAKDDLLKYCERERISYFPFNNFNDVMDRMEILRQKKRLKKRHQAELKRRNVYIQE
ncbi:MAG TPA: MtnX-like HAD-IB family phosphatase [Ignavibacteriaceae bacterium]|nr:MtnX-like HAD-IB family phosphatase [Ignavibacteriaceae bacterium]